MGQIMRLRRIAGSDFHIEDRNNGYRHEHAFVKNIRRNGLLHEADLLPDSYGGKFNPRAVPELLASLPIALRGDAARQDHARPRRCCTRTRPPRSCARSSTRSRAKPERYELNLYVSGTDEDNEPAARRRGGAVMKVAYWPGCVSRGFTPELHGSMALVAPLLDIELIELDRANCCGAGVIAEHNQELADTLNARTFALAQQTDGELMMNICSTCQGAQTECQERLDASADYRAQINDTLSVRGPALRARASPTRTSSGCWSRRSASTRCARKVKRPLTNLRVGPFYGCYIVRPAERARHRRRAPAPRATSSR